MAQQTTFLQQPLDCSAAGKLLLCLSFTLGLLGGCQSPLRSFKKNEPSIEELLVMPQPWDAELRNENDDIDRAVSGAPNAKASRGHAVQSQAARPNPYAVKSRSKSNAGDVEADYAPANAPTEAEFQAAYAAAPPHLRPLLKRQWDATQARRGRRGSRSDRPADSDYVQSQSDYADDQYDSADEYVDGQRYDDEYQGYDEQEYDERGMHHAAVGLASNATGPAHNSERMTREPNSRPGERSMQPRSRNERSSNAQAASPRGRAQAPATYHFSDADEEENEPAEPVGRSMASLPPHSTGKPVRYAFDDPNQQLVQQPSTPTELAPPPGKKSSRQVPHAEPVDTGAGDEVTVLPATASGANDSRGSMASHKGRPVENAGYVVPASAEDRSMRSASSKRSEAGDGTRQGSDSRATNQSGNQSDDQAGEQSRESSKSPSAGPGQKLTWQESARETLRLIEEERQSAHNSSPSQQLHYQALDRLVHLSLGELEPALKPIDGLDNHEQDFFRHEFQALHNAIDANGNPVLSRRWALVMDSQRQALTHLGAVSNLEVKNAAFCSSVDGFGAITKFPTYQFKPNQELLLYCEIDNFVSESVKDGFETKLQGNYEIVSANSVRVADVLLPEEVDVCRHQRRDYFFAYRVYVPQKIEPGRYQLRLTIEDMKGRKYGQSTLDFQVVQ